MLGHEGLVELSGLAVPRVSGHTSLLHSADAILKLLYISWWSRIARARGPSWPGSHARGLGGAGWAGSRTGGGTSL